MAIFKRSEPATPLLQRIQGKLYRDKDELAELLAEVERLQVRARDLLWTLSHRDGEVRAFGERCLLRERDDGALLDLLLGEMLGQADDVRRDIARIAWQREPRQVELRIAQLSCAPKREQREIALTMVSLDPDWMRHLGVIKRALRDPEPAFRRWSVQLLSRGVATNPTIFTILRGLVGDEDPELRIPAIHALARAACPEIVEPFLERLPHEAESERAVIVRALAGLARDARARIDERILPALADEREAVRGAAVQLLRQLPDRVRFLRAFLAEAPQLAYWLRERCTRSLLRHGSDLVEPLLELMADPDQEVRVGAVTMAGEIRDPRFAEAMARVLASGEDWWIRGLAADVLAELSGGDAVPHLAAQLNDPAVRYAMIAALGKTRSPAALRHLAAALQDPVRGIRSCALDAMREMAGPEAVDAVARVAVHDQHGELRDKALAALRAMGPAGEDAAQRHEQAAAQGEVGGEPPPAELAGLEMENEDLNRPPSGGPAAPGC